MKDFILDLVKYILNLLLNRERKEVAEEPVLEPVEEEIEEEPIIEQVEIKEVLNDLKTSQKEVHKMLSLKERQKYLKKIGLYTKKIDGIVGKGHKKAVTQFNIIFLNKSTDTYYEKTDELLRAIYKSYVASPYMVASDWKYFKNCQEKEYFCTCKKKYCDGWNGLRKKIPMHLIMMDQYIRNYFDEPVTYSCSVRCPKRNKEVGGVSNSKHIVFRSNDLKCKGIKSKKVVELIYKGTNKLPFVNYSYSINDYYTHGDVKI